MRTEVTGNTYFSDIDFEKNLSIKNVDFRGTTTLNNRKFAGSVIFESCTFDQPLDLSKTVFENGLCFSGCSFGASGKRLDQAVLSLDDAKICGDVAFYEAKTRGRITARRLQLAGSLDFAACTIEAESNDDPLLDLGSSKIDGSVNFETNKLPEALARLIAERPDASVTAKAHRIPRSSFKNRKDTVSINLGAAKVTEDVVLSCAHFVGRVNLPSIKCSGLTSKAEFFALPTGVSQNLPSEQTTLGANESFGGAIIEGGLTLSGGRFGLIHLHGIAISGEINLIDGRSGQIQIEDSIRNGKDNEIFIAPASIGNFIMVRWHCRDFLRLHAHEIKEVPNEWGIRGITVISTKIDRAVSLWPGRSLELKLQGYLEGGAANKKPPRFFASTEAGKLVDVENNPDCRKFLNRWQRRLVLRGNIVFDHTTIGDDLVLTGVEVKGRPGFGDGRIDILNSNIDGEVIFRSPITFLADSRLTSPLLHLLARRFVASGDAHDSAFAVAICHTLDMRGVDAKKVDLTGLRIQEGANDQSKSLPSPASHPIALSTINLPNATLSNVKVSGRVAAFARLNKSVAAGIREEIDKVLKGGNNHSAMKVNASAGDEKKNWERELLKICFDPQASPLQTATQHLEARTEIPGAFELQHAEIGELVISDASFQDHRSEYGAIANGIIFDYAQVSKLYVARSKADKDNPYNSSRHNGFPVPVSLADLSVKSWFLEDDDLDDVLKGDAPETAKSYIDREATLADPYLDLLDNDPVFRMSSYLTIEKSLHDRGLTDEARKIFIAGTYRDVRTESVKKGPERDNQPPTAKAGTATGPDRDRGSNAEENDAEKMPRPGLDPKTWRNWKYWQRGHGRYRNTSIGQLHKQLKSGERGLRARVALFGLAIAFAAEIPLVDQSPLGWGYAAVVLLSVLGSIYAGGKGGSESRLGLISIALALLWGAGLLYGAVVIAMWLSPIAFGYVAAIVLIMAATESSAGLKGIEPEHRGVVVYAMSISVAALAIITLLVKPSPLAFVYLIIVVCVLSGLHGTLFRLRRPQREYWGFTFCFVWCAGCVFLSVYAVTHLSLRSVGALTLWLGGLWPLAAAMRCFFDQLYWSLVDYGTSAWRLAGVIFVLMAISFALVSPERNNFAPTLLARSIRAAQQNPPLMECPVNWPFGERLWMTLRYHVPLVGAVISDDWQPADRPLRLAGATTSCQDTPTSSSLDRYWPTAVDWYAFMMWTNWVLWPLFLPFLIRTLSRER